MFFTQNSLIFTFGIVKIPIKVSKTFKNFFQIKGTSNTFLTSTIPEGASNRGRASNMGGASIMGRGLPYPQDQCRQTFHQLERKSTDEIVQVHLNDFLVTNRVISF